MKHVAGVLAFACLLSVGAGSTAQDHPVIAARDVEPPKKVHAPAPQYPGIARQVGVQGLVLLEVTLKEDGAPTEIRVSRGIPLLDMAAIEAVKGWRYESTVVDGSPRRVKVVEAVEFFFSDGERGKAYRDLALDPRQQPALRVFAVSQLVQLPAKQHKMVVKTLSQLLEDAEQNVAAAAASGLSSLPAESK